MENKEFDIGATVKKKKLFLNKKNNRWCTVHLYNFKYDMQQAYKKYCKERGQKYNEVLGASTHYEKLYISEGGKERLGGETGIVFLCVEHCGAGIVSHELMHAVLYAWKHRKGKDQYPIVINNMEDEEDILQNHTYAVRQFYEWFYLNVNTSHPNPSAPLKSK